MIALDSLLSNEIVELGMIVSTSDALFVALRRRPEVIELRKCLASQAIDPIHVESFVSQLLQRIEPGKRSVWDVSLAALAVTLDRKPGPFAEKYLKGLSSLKVRELPLSPKVASLALEARKLYLAGRTTKIFRISSPVPRQSFAIEDSVSGCYSASSQQLSRHF